MVVFLLLSDDGVLGDAFRDDCGWVAAELLAGVHGVVVGGSGGFQEAEPLLAQNRVLGSDPFNNTRKGKKSREKENDQFQECNWLI